MIRSLERSLEEARDRVSVIFLDQNATPIALPESILNDPKFTRILVPVPAVSQARNQVVLSAEVDWVIFCDDDGYLAPGYVDRLIEVMSEEPNIDIFAGSIRRIDNQDFYSQRHGIGGDLNQFWNTKLLMGSNFVIKRSVFEKLGRFDERFGAGSKWGSGEETDLAWNAYFEKVPMKYEPSLVVFHIPPRAGEWRDEVRKAYRYGLGKGALVVKWLIFKRHPIVFFEAAEMIALPVVRGVLALIKLNFKMSIIQAATWLGRVKGFWLALFSL